MARLEKEVVLKDVDGNDVKFFLTQYDAFNGIKYKKKLAKILFPAFIAAQKASTEGQNPDFIFFEKLMENIDEIEPAFIKEFVLAGAYKDGRVTINFENDFAGNYGLLLTLVQELATFNFIDVFRALGSQE
jgi:hypothetical protein